MKSRFSLICAYLFCCWKTASPRLQGPFGAPAQRVWEFRTVMVVGAGIGAPRRKKTNEPPLFARAVDL